MAQETLNMYRNELNTIFENYLQPIQSIIQKEKDSQAIIEYDATNPYFSYWYYEYLNSKSLDANCVKMIIMIGDVDEDDIENIKVFYPSAQITIIDKSITEITIEDIYIKHNFVTHSFGDLFLKHKASFHKTLGIYNQYETVARRPELEKLISIINNSRFFYNFFIGLLDNDDFDWQFDFLVNSIKYDYNGYPYSNRFFTFGNIRLSSLRWNKDDEKTYLTPKLFFYDKKYPEPQNIAWTRKRGEVERFKDILSMSFCHTTPLKKTKYIESLSRRDCDNLLSLLESGNSFEEIKKSDSELVKIGWHLPFMSYKGDSLYIIASEFNCLMLYKLFHKSKLLFNKIVEVYEEAAKDGIVEAYNNLGIMFYVIGEKEKSKSYFLRGLEYGVENAIINLINDSTGCEKENYIRALNETEKVLSRWINALDKWSNHDYLGAINIFHELYESKDAQKVFIENNNVADHSLNNLLFFYLYGVEEYGIKPDFNELQHLITDCKKVDLEALAVLLNDNILKSNNTYYNCFSFLEDKYRQFTSRPSIMSPFNKKSPWERMDKKRMTKSLVYNLACCYESGIGCNLDRQQAINVCKTYIEQQGEESEVYHLLGELHFRNKEYDRAIDIWSKIEDKSFNDKLNIACAMFYIDRDKSYRLYDNLFDLIDFNEFAIKSTLNSEYYFERLNLFEFYYHNKQKSLDFANKAVENNIVPSFFYLAKFSDSHENKSELLRNYVMLGGRKGWGIDEFIGRLLINKQIKEALHFMLLYEQSELKKESSFKYHIYNLLPLVSRIKDEEFLWLNKAAMNHNERAAIEYSKYLKNKGDIISAINYLNNYLQYEEATKNLETIDSLDYYNKDGFEDDYLPSINLEGIQSVLDGYYYQLHEQDLIAKKSDYVQPQPNAWYHLNEIKEEDVLSVGIQCMCYHFWEKYESKESFSQQNMEEDRDEYINRARNEFYDSSEDYERDRWDALTDGQYGDYPGGDIDYDNFGY